MSEHLLRLHKFLPASYANGPGRRAVIWVQGCSLGCPGCSNPETHSPLDGELVRLDDLYARILALEETIEGVSISGGEPLQQPRPLLNLVKRIRRSTTLSILLFTGFTWDEIERMSFAPELLSIVDVIIAGRYDQDQPLQSGLVSSANQTAHFLTDRYSSHDLEVVPPGEVIISEDGEITVSGVDTLAW